MRYLGDVREALLTQKPDDVDKASQSLLVEMVVRVAKIRLRKVGLLRVAVRACSPPCADDA